jgi:hypothetical protein
MHLIGLTIINLGKLGSEYHSYSLQSGILVPQQGAE